MRVFLSYVFLFSILGTSSPALAIENSDSGFYELVEMYEDRYSQTIKIQNDIGCHVEVILHRLGDDFTPSGYDEITSLTDEGNTGYSCFRFRPGVAQTILLSYRYNGKLYQRLVMGITSSAVIELSKFIERSEDDYFIGNNRYIAYSDSYRDQLKRSIRDLAEQQSIKG